MAGGLCAVVPSLVRTYTPPVPVVSALCSQWYPVGFGIVPPPAGMVGSGVSGGSHQVPYWLTKYAQLPANFQVSPDAPGTGTGEVAGAGAAAPGEAPPPPA